MGKGKAAGFHSCADGFAVCRAAPCVIRHEHGAADRGEYRKAAGAKEKAAGAASAYVIDVFGFVVVAIFWFT